MSKRDANELTGETTATEKSGKRLTLTRTVVRPLTVKTAVRAGKIEPEWENREPHPQPKIVG